MNQFSSYSAILEQTNQPQDYPSTDIHPVFIQYMLSLIIILLINLITLYQFVVEVWYIYEQNTNEQVHDIYDKMILLSSVKYVAMNIMCIAYFNDLTNPPVQLFKVYWLYIVAIVFIKLQIKNILYPALLLFMFVTLFAVLWNAGFSSLPVFKLILVLSSVIIYYAAIQIHKITKILNSYHYQKTKKTEISIQSLLQKDHILKSKNQYDQLTMNLELDDHIICHLQNRRSFCIVFSITLIINIVLYLGLEAGKEFLGEVMLNLALDVMPLYTVYWYLSKNRKEQKNILIENTNSQDNSEVRANRRSSKIVIEMVNLKT